MSTDAHPPMNAERLLLELRNGAIVIVRPKYNHNVHGGYKVTRVPTLLRQDMTSEIFQYSALQSLIYQKKVVCVEVWSGNKYTWALSPK